MINKKQLALEIKQEVDKFDKALMKCRNIYLSDNDRVCRAYNIIKENVERKYLKTSKLCNFNKILTLFIFFSLILVLSLSNISLINNFIS